jgi:hypothetical protein
MRARGVYFIDLLFAPEHKAENLRAILAEAGLDVIIPATSLITD